MTRPPRVLEWLLARLLPGRQREFALGDLREEYGVRRRSHGRLRAAGWYATEIARSIGPAAARVWGEGLRGANELPAIGLPPSRRGPGQRVDGMVRSVRFAARSMRRGPGRAALISGTLAAGIGATTAVFTIVDRILLRPPPYDDPSELVTIWNTYNNWRGHEVLDEYWDTIGLSYPEYVDWRDGQTAFEAVAIYSVREATLTDRGDPTRLVVGGASDSLWPLLGVEPALGRAFAAGESGPGAAPVAVLSHRLWTDRWGADPGAIGAMIRLDDRPYTVIGVLPPEFRFLSVGRAAVSRIDVWLPVGASAEALEERGVHSYEAIARTGPGGLDDGAAEQARRLIWPGRSSEVRGVRIVPRLDEEVAEARGPLLLLLGAVGVLMLIACVNVATLFLGSVAGRRAELATRAALGAGRGRLLAQLAVEAVIHGVLGIIGGVVLGAAALRLLVRWAPADLRLPPDIALDLRVLAIMSTLGLVTSLLFGLVPAVLVRRLDLQGELRSSPGRTMAGGWRAQRTLVGAQFGLSLVLVIGTGLLARSLAAELSVDPGFDGRNVLSAYVSLPSEAYPTADARSAFVSEATARVATVPGVARVSGISALPFSGRGGSSSFDLVGREPPPGQGNPEAVRRAILPGLHETLGIQLLAGRTFDERERDGGRHAVIVSRAMAERFWPGESALGQYIARDGFEWEIVGVVDDILAEDLKAEPKPTFYTPFHMEEPGWRSAITLVVEGVGDPAGLAAAVRRTLWSVDGALALDEMEPVPALLARATAAQRYRTFLLSLFAVIATLLSGVGAFGVVARGLVHRTRDLGIRLALGAGPGRLVGEEIGREMTVVGIGLGLGILVALLGARLVSGFLFGVSGYDPLTYGAAVAGLAGLGVVATLVATRRIAKLDPARVLRAD